MKKILFHFTLVVLAAAGFSCAGDLDRFSRYSIPPEAVTEADLPAMYCFPKPCHQDGKHR